MQRVEVFILGAIYDLLLPCPRDSAINREGSRDLGENKCFIASLQLIIRQIERKSA